MCEKAYKYMGIEIWMKINEIIAMIQNNRNREMMSSATTQQLQSFEERTLSDQKISHMIRRSVFPTSGLKI